MLPRVSPVTRGVAHVTNARWDAVDEVAAVDERSLSRTAKSCGPGAPVLALSFVGQVLRSDGGKKAGHRGEREVSRKPLRREGRIASAEPVCSCVLSFVHFAHETAGAARTRSSLRPLFAERVKVTKISGASRHENADACPFAV